MRVMHTKRKVSDDAKRTRETYRCAFCGKFIRYETDGFFDREDRMDESSSVLVFCNEAHADANHRRTVQRKYDEAFIYTAPAQPL
jgi:hypothetical protein